MNGNWYTLIALLIVCAMVTIVAIAENLSHKPSKNPLKITDNKISEHPLFKLPITEIEIYLTTNYTKKLIFIINRDISSSDPNALDELFARGLVEFMEDLTDLIPLFEKYLGKKYLETYITNMFRELQISGQLARMITSYASR